MIKRIVPWRLRNLQALTKTARAAERFIHRLGDGGFTNGAVAERELPVNPLREYFEAHREGRGIWKWQHYFDVYHRHLQKFVGKPVGVLEIGIYSGGSLEMWRNYFGNDCTIYGVDIEQACKSYENEHTHVFIGDQADRLFWADVRNKVPNFDVVIDDGGHTPEQQIVSLEELLPRLRPGGVYICEDVHDDYNRFAYYVQRIAGSLNAYDKAENSDDPERRLACGATPLQAHVHSVHIYPYVVVIERTAEMVKEFVAPKHGTQWQPFFEPTASGPRGA